MITHTIHITERNTFCTPVQRTSASWQHSALSVVSSVSGQRNASSFRFLLRAPMKRRAGAWFPQIFQHMDKTSTDMRRLTTGILSEKCVVRRFRRWTSIYTNLDSREYIVLVIKSRRMRWAGHVARMGEERAVYRVLMGKTKGKRPLGRPRRRWVDNIRMDLQEVGCEYVDWTGLAQDRDRCRTLVSAVMNLRVPWNEGNFLTNCKPVSFSRRTLLHGASKQVRQYSIAHYTPSLYGTAYCS